MISYETIQSISNDFQYKAVLNSLNLDFDYYALDNLRIYLALRDERVPETFTSLYYFYNLVKDKYSQINNDDVLTTLNNIKANFLSRILFLWRRRSYLEYMKSFLNSNPRTFELLLEIMSSIHSEGDIIEVLQLIHSNSEHSHFKNKAILIFEERKKSMDFTSQKIIREFGDNIDNNFLI